MSEQTTVHSHWTVPCLLGRTAGTCGRRNVLESALPKCMCARGLGAPSPSPMMLHTDHCVSLHKQPPQHPCRTRWVSTERQLGQLQRARGRWPAPRRRQRLAWEGPVSAGRDGARAPQIPGQRPSFLPAVRSCSMYMCNYSAAYWLTLRLALMLTVTWPFPGFYLSLWQISSGKFHFRTGKFQ